MSARIPPWVEPWLARTYVDGPDGYDCWDFALEVLRVQFGFDVQEREYQYERGRAGRDARAGLAAREREQWDRLAPGTEREGDLAVFMPAGVPDHIGVIVAPGRFMHCTRGSNVAIERLDSSHWAPRLEGIYRHRSASCAV